MKNFQYFNHMMPVVNDTGKRTELQSVNHNIVPCCFRPIQVESWLQQSSRTTPASMKPSSSLDSSFVRNKSFYAKPPFPAALREWVNERVVASHRSITECRLHLIIRDDFKFETFSLWAVVWSLSFLTPLITFFDHPGLSIRTQFGRTKMMPGRFHGRSSPTALKAAAFALRT